MTNGLRTVEIAVAEKSVLVAALLAFTIWNAETVAFEEIKLLFFSAEVELHSVFVALMLKTLLPSSCSNTSGAL